MKIKSYAQFAKRLRSRGVPENKIQERWLQHKQAVETNRDPTERVTPKKSTRPKFSLEDMENFALGPSGETTMHRLTLPRQINQITFHGLTEKQVFLAGKIVSNWGQGIRLPNVANTNYNTALYRSYQEFRVISSNDTSNLGRFSCAVRPCLGSTNDPSTYGSAIVIDTDGEWGDFNDASSYVTSSNGFNYRMDPNSYQLTGQPESNFTYTGNTAMSGALPLGTDPTLGASQPNGFFLDYNNSTGAISIPANSEWFIAFKIQGTIMSAPVFTAGTATVTNNQTATNGAATAMVGYCNVANSTTSDQTFIFTLTATTVTSSVFNITTRRSQEVGNTGYVSAIRPVSMNAWFNTTLSSFYGGTISAAVVPENAYETNYVGDLPSNGTGYLQNWENMGQIQGVYNGPVQNGAYCFWLPSSPDQLDFETPDVANSKAFNSIIFSGEINNSDGSVGGVTVGILRVCTVYEFQTTCTLFPTGQTQYDIRDLEKVNMFLRNINQAMENSKHKSFFDKLLRGARKSSRTVKNIYDNWKDEATAFAPMIASLF